MSPYQHDAEREWQAKYVQLAQKGNPEAFRWLMEHHQDGIFRFLMGMVGDAEDARDLTQHTFMNVSQKVATLRNPLQFKPWLYRIARNLAYDYLRHQKRKSWLSWEQLEVEGGTFGEDGPEAAVAEADFVRQTLARLPPKLRECFLLFVVGGLSAREIAEMVGIGEASVPTYVSNARTLFKQVYKQQMVELEIDERGTRQP